MEKKLLLILTVVCCNLCIGQQKNAPGDWLIIPYKEPVTIEQTNGGKDLVVSNGLARRSFRLQPNLACFDYTNLINGQQLVRAVAPEARITIDGCVYNIGGLEGQPERAYLLPKWLDTLRAEARAFNFQSFDTGRLVPFIQWNSKGWWHGKANTTNAMRISFHFTSNLPLLHGIKVSVHYGMYEGLPLMVKWVTVKNESGSCVVVNSLVHEILHMPEEESAVAASAESMPKPQGLYVETNYAFNNAMRYPLSDQTLHWKTDPLYTSQVNYAYNTPCIMEIYPEQGQNETLMPGETFTSSRSYELQMDSYDRERRGLAIRRMYTAIAPWTLANPIFMHLVSKNDEEVKNAVDQCKATGYEAVILSFGSHLQMEDTSAVNIKKWKALADYAHANNIRIGGYALFSSRRISDEDDVIDTKTGKPGGAVFGGHAPCFGSKWGIGFSKKIKTFFDKTGFDIWENDGPYPGDLCASTSHTGHKSVEDSQWKQWHMQAELYHWLNERGVYINSPDWYFLDGSHKVAIGYREVNFSLPRERQKLLNRQNIFDGTWDKLTSMGWGFVPLTVYQGGGDEAVLEPLHKHLADYEQLMMQYYGAGVQACYRGPRIYDTEETKQVVVNVIDWYKKYRDILNSDIIHLRRPDGRSWDGIMHVNAGLKQKALIMLYNPTEKPMATTISIPLYYTGLKDIATIAEKAIKGKQYAMDRDYSVQLPVSLAPKSYSWWTVE